MLPLPYTCSTEFKEKFSEEEQLQIFCLIDFCYLEEDKLPELESGDIELCHKNAMRDPSYREYYEQEQLYSNTL